MIKTAAEKANKKNHNKYAYAFFKRIFDFLAAVVLLLLLSPVMLLIAILIRADSKGPIFYKHVRIGRYGKDLAIYKFRSMINNADEMINNFTSEQMAEWKKNYKLDNDPRITGIGKFLRKTSLDELPQLINILTGNMSMVGPRPITNEELLKYGDDAGEFLSAKPGLTGYWQANGRNSITYEQRIEMELYYVRNRSIWFDLQILLKTVYAVALTIGAK